MSIGSEGQSSTLEMLSAMADGEVDSTATARACLAWREDALVRQAWHSYQLIGDVLRSEDLAIPHGSSLLAALRARLAEEPTVLAPASDALPASGSGGLRLDTGRRARWAWVAPSAVAAGFVLVAGALMVIREPAPGEGGMLAAITRLNRSPAPEVVLDNALQPRAGAVDPRLMRDSRLDRYLAAHQQFAGSTALGVPSGFLRNAAAEAPNR